MAAKSPDETIAGREPADQRARPAARDCRKLSAAEGERAVQPPDGRARRAPRTASPSSACATTSACRSTTASRASFPRNITAKMFSFKEYPFFQAPPEAKQVPKVNFSISRRRSAGVPLPWERLLWSGRPRARLLVARGDPVRAHRLPSGRHRARLVHRRGRAQRHLRHSAYRESRHRSAARHVGDPGGYAATAPPARWSWSAFVAARSSRRCWICSRASRSASRDRDSRSRGARVGTAGRPRAPARRARGFIVVPRGDLRSRHRPASERRRR